MSETPTAYSVEEHMFNQDEIDKRHPLTAAPSITNGGAPCKQCFGRGIIQMERGNDEPCPRCKGSCCEPTDQQRSEAEWKELDEQAMTSEQFDKLAPTLRAAHIEAEQQQRSDADIERLIVNLVRTASYSGPTGIPMSELIKADADAIRATIAERDATIAELRAANERLVAGQSTWYRTAEAQDKQVARLEAEIPSAAHRGT